MKIFLTLSLLAALQGVRAQQDVCADDTTPVQSPWLFSDSDNCADLIASVPDFYNDVYLSECARQTGLAKPNSVDNAFIGECYTMSNGTVKYKATICCPGTLQNQRCFACKNSTIEYDREKRTYLPYRCNHLESVQSCPSGQVCATVYHFANGKLVDKMCMEENACTSAYGNNTNTCKSGIAQPSCTYCCDTPLCNYYYSVPYLVAGDACNSNPCYYNQQCILDSSLSAGYRCNCTGGTSGDKCQYNMCTRNPCQNLGYCRVSNAAPYYECNCRTGWHGVNCTEAYSLCDATYAGYCLNGGVCFDHKEFGPRCKCPEGYHGTNCELKAYGEERCSDPDLYYKNTGTYITSIGVYRCTNRSSYYSEIAGRSESYGRICAVFMGQGYNPGMDGEITKPESLNLYQCESGDEYQWFSYDVCCPSCTRKPCQNGGWCIQNGDDFVCRCRLGYGGDRCQFKEALCFLSGDPHILTFDSKNLHPQGICKYTVANSIAGDTPFQVSSKFERRGSNNLVSYIKYIEITVYGHTIRLDRNNVVYVDGVQVDPMMNPVYANGKLTISMNGNFVRVGTDFGLVVENDGQWTALVKMPTDFVNVTEGLCGNNDGDAYNDMTTKDGMDVTGMEGSQSLLANSFQVDDPEDPQCKKEVMEDLPECEAAMKKTISDDDGLCGLVVNANDASNPFRSCLTNPQMNSAAFAENCIFDVCALQGDDQAMKEAACGTLAALATQCKSLGIVVDWRAAADCPLNCTGGRTYEVSAAPCLLTCSNPKAVSQCSLPNAETCVCPTGMVFHEGRCQQSSVCGCMDDNGGHHEIGDIWLSDDCCEKYTCTECNNCPDSFGKIEVAVYECPSGETCSNGTCENNDPCTSDPCQNGATCYMLHDTSTFYCICAEGYKGIRCEIEDLCFNFECNGGMCLEREDQAYCDCTGIYSGTHCDEEPCTPNPCQNNGTCEAVDAQSYNCTCPDGFRGDECEEKDPCFEFECKNGASCLEREGNVYCACTGIYSGKYCDEEPCTPNPCQNQGTCKAVSAQSYECICPDGFRGEDCEETDPCYNSGCKNGASCLEREGKAYCACTGIYSGKYCDEEPCTPNPCQNNGVCTALTADSYNCSCPEGYQGRNCEHKITYTYGNWSEWICAMDGQFRERECFKMPDNVVVDDSFCVGESHQARDVVADCTKCEDLVNGRAFLAHECDNQAYWVCELVKDHWRSTKMSCGACTRWSQTDLTCILVDGPCDVKTTSTAATSTSPQIITDPDSCVAAGGNIYKQIADNPNSYLWVVQGGLEYVMPCAPGTSFDLSACGCLHSQVDPVVPSDSDVITCLDFSVLGRWGFSGSKWKWISNVNGVAKMDNCGVSGSCANFDGSSHLEIAYFQQSSNSNNLSPFTISLWFKKDGSVSGTEHLIEYGYCDEYDSISMRVESDTTIGAGVITTEGDYMDAFSGTSVTANSWHHLVLVFDSNAHKLRFFIDGALASEKQAAGVLQYRYCPMVIGRLFKGLIDEVCFYGTALSEAEVSSLYQSGLGY